MIPGEFLILAAFAIAAWIFDRLESRGFRVLRGVEVWPGGTDSPSVVLDSDSTRDQIISTPRNTRTLTGADARATRGGSHDQHVGGSRNRKKTSSHALNTAGSGECLSPASARGDKGDVLCRRGASPIPFDWAKRQPKKSLGGRHGGGTQSEEGRGQSHIGAPLRAFDWSVDG